MISFVARPFAIIDRPVARAPGSPCRRGLAAVVGAILAVSVGALAPAPALAWQRALDGSGLARALALDASGNTVASVTMVTEADTAMVAAKLDATTGEPVWTKALGVGSGTGVAVDGAGDVVVAGRRAGGALGLVKLAGVDGDELWRRKLAQAQIEEGGAAPFDLAPDGDPFVATARVGKKGRTTGFVHRLHGAGGARRWRTKLPGLAPVALVADASGNAVVLARGQSATASTVVKTRGADGQVLWSRSVPVAPDGGLVRRPNGDVIVFGLVAESATSSKMGLIDLDGASGGERWRHLAANAAAIRVAVASSGDVVAALDVTSMVSRSGEPPSPVRSVSVVKLNGTSGEELWNKTIVAPSSDDCGASALVLDAAGAPFFGGCAMSAEGTHLRFELVKLKADGGNVLWRRAVEGELSAPLLATRPVGALALDGMGNIAAAGASAAASGDLAFTVVKWDADNASDLLSPADRACAATILTAGQNYLATRLQALQGCRDRINTGTLAIDPADCAEERATKRELDNAHTRIRRSIADKCAPALPAGISCAAALDDLVGPDGRTGCLVESHDRIADELTAVAYGAPLTGSSGAVVTCQGAIGTAGRRLVNMVMSAFNACFAGGVPSVESCTTRPRYLADVLDAAKRARARIANGCSAANLPQVGGCGETLDDLVSADGSGGCLLGSHRVGAEAAVRAQR